MSKHHEHLPGEEHPRSHALQIAVAIGFQVVWVLDSFVLSLTTHPAELVPWFLRWPAGLSLVALSILLMRSAERALFRMGRETPGVVERGALAHVRHPLYLGVLLFYLGLALTTFSIATTAALVVAFLVYDRLATYEERELERVLGGHYREYRRRVPKWLPTPRRSGSSG